MTGVPQGSVLGLALCDIFVSSIGTEIRCTLNRFACDPKLCGVINIKKGRDVIQRDLARL